MPSKSTIAASAAAVAMAMAPAASAAPVSAATEQCVSLGKGAFGYNASDISIYATAPPATYLTVNDNRVVASNTPTYESQSMFEFFNCSYQAPPYEGKGSVDTYQGYIKAPDGNCVTVEKLKSKDSAVTTEPCQFNGNAALGNVDAKQHFQFQLDSFYNYYSAVFLGKTQGPVNASDFGAGGNYHFQLSNGDLVASYDKNQPQTGDRKEQLIGQIGSQYKPTTKTMPACKLIRSGEVELVNTSTGEVTNVTAGYTYYMPYAYSPILNGTDNANFSFYQCDSSYMGYQSDSANSYGHFASDAFSGSCFSKQNNSDEVLEGPHGGCSLDDTSAQESIYFHLAQTDNGYEVNFVGVPASANAQQYAWTTYRDPKQSATDPTALVVYASATEYKLRFKN